jgi:hypothetical protein
MQEGYLTWMVHLSNDLLEFGGVGGIFIRLVEYGQRRKWMEKFGAFDLRAVYVVRVTQNEGRLEHLVSKTRFSTWTREFTS